MSSLKSVWDTSPTYILFRGSTLWPTLCLWVRNFFYILFHHLLLSDTCVLISGLWPQLVLYGGTGWMHMTLPCNGCCQYQYSHLNQSLLRRQTPMLCIRLLVMLTLKMTETNPKSVFCPESTLKNVLFSQQACGVRIQFFFLLVFSWSSMM